MKLLRLQVQVLPWQDTTATTWDHLSRKEVILPWTEPCPENLRISELAERIQMRFENIHKGKGKLRIKWLEDGYCGILDGNDTVTECFADRTGGMAHVKDFTVRVARFPPDPQELQNPARFASLAPESTARPQKRHRNHLLELATSGRQGHSQGKGACGVANKRQRVRERQIEGDIDPDRPVPSSERDLYELYEEPGRSENCTSAYIVADSQPSPRNDQYISYGTPQSLSVSSHHGLLASGQTELVTTLNSSPHRDISLAGDIEKLVQSSIDTQPKSESPDPQNLFYTVPHPYAGTPVAGQDPVNTLALGPFVKPSLPASKIKSSHLTGSNTAQPSNTGTTLFRTPERHLQASTTVAASEGRLTRHTHLTKPNCSGHNHEGKTQGRKLVKDIYEPIESDLESFQDLPPVPGTERAKTKHSPNLKPQPFSRINNTATEGQIQSYTIPDATEVLFEWPGSTLHPVENKTEVASDTAAQPKRPVSAGKTQLQPQRGNPGVLDLSVHRALYELTKTAKVASKKSGYRSYGLQQTGEGDIASPLESWEGRGSDSSTRIGKDQDRDPQMEQRARLSPGIVESHNEEHASEQARKVGGPERRERVKDSRAQQPPGVEFTEATMHGALTPVNKKGAGSSGKKIQAQKAAEKESKKVGKVRAAAEKNALKDSGEKKPPDQRAKENKKKRVDDQTARRTADLLAVTLAKEQKIIEETQKSESRVSPYHHLGSEDSDRSIAPRQSCSESGNLAFLVDREPEYSQVLPCVGTNLDKQVPLPSVLRGSSAISRRSVSFVEQPIENLYATCREASVKTNIVDKSQYDALLSSIDVEMNEPPVATSKELVRPANAKIKSRESSKRPDTSERKQSKLTVTKTIEHGKARTFDQLPPPMPSDSKTVIEPSESEPSSSSDTKVEPPPVDVVAGPSKRQSTSTLLSIKSDGGTPRFTSVSHEPTTKLERRIGSAARAPKLEHVIVGVRSQSESLSRSPAREVVSSASSSLESESESDSDFEKATERVPPPSLEAVPNDQQRPSTTSKEIPFVVSLEKDLVASSSPVRTNGQKPSRSPEIPLPTFRKSLTASEISSSEDEAEQQLQREARQSTKPFQTPKIAATKASGISRASVHAGGSANKLSLNGVRPAYGRFPSLSGLKSNNPNGIRDQPMARQLPGFVAPIEPVHPSLRNTIQGNGSRISDGSSSESSNESSSSDEDRVKPSRATGALGGYLDQAAQGKSTKGMHGLLKIARKLEAQTK